MRKSGLLDSLTGVADDNKVLLLSGNTAGGAEPGGGPFCPPPAESLSFMFVASSSMRES